MSLLSLGKKTRIANQRKQPLRVLAVSQRLGFRFCGDLVRKLKPATGSRFTTREETASR